MLAWLYLDFPNLQLESLFKGCEDQAIAVLDSTGNLFQLSAHAKKLGLKKGQGLGQAALLAPELSVYAYQSDSEISQLEDICYWLYSVTADIALVKPRGLLLATESMLPLYANSETYWRAITERLSALGLSYRFASAHTPLMAKALALAGVNSLFSKEQEAIEALKHCAITVGDIVKKEQNTLARIGIRSLFDLVALPLDELAKRYSPELVSYVGRLIGKLHHAIRFYIPKEGFKKYLAFNYEITAVKQLNKPLEVVLNQQEHYLKLHGLCAYQISLELHFREQADLTITLASAQAEYKTAHWLALITLRLENVALPEPSIGLTLSAEHLTAANANEQDLFTAQHASMTPLALTALLQAKLGDEQVKMVACHNDLRPEFASREVLNSQHQTMQQSSAVIRPSLMLAKPQPLTMATQASYGPERITTGWWDNATIERDYFIAQDETGRWLWLYRTSQQNWFVHGIFS